MVADFGIALALSAAAGGRMTETGMSLGTPHYMSPEQATAEKDITNRSDIYSLGSVLYEMLTGSPPHVGSSAQQIIMKIVTDDARPVTELRKSVPPNVAAAVAKALEKLPADRYASAAEFADAFQRPLAGGLTTPPPLTLRSRRRVVLLAVGAVTVAAAGYTAGRGTAPGLRTAPAVTRVVIDVPDAPRQPNEYGPTVHLAAGRAGVIYSGPGGVRWFRPLDSLRARPIASSSGAWLTPGPDGTHVAVREGGWVGRLSVVPIDGGGSRLVSDSVMNIGIDWSDDGYLYVTATDLVLARIEQESGRLERLTTLDQAAGEILHGHSEALPGGRGVLFTVGHRSFTDLDSAYVAVLDLRNGSRALLFPGFSPKYSTSGHVMFATADGSLRAVAFDLNSLTPRGTPVVIAQQVKIRRPDGGGADFDLSRNGDDLVYVTAGTELRDHLVWVNKNGAVLSVDSAWPGRVRGIGLSPDGSKVAASIQRDRGANNIWLRELPSGQPFRLTSGTVLDAVPHWSPDGRAIIFGSPRPPDRLDWDLYVQGIEGRSDSLLVDGVSTIRDAVWSPDGTHLVWEETRVGSSDIFSRELQADARTVPLLATRFNETAPTIAPDGRWLAYVSNETGRSEVFIRSTDAAASGSWQVSDAGGDTPRWSHSGKELFYIDTTQTLVSAFVEMAPTPRVVSSRALFSVAAYQSGPGFEVAPGDQQFLFVRRPATRAAGEIVLVQNFVEELKAKVGRE